jgi:hypothetical protein
MQAEAAKTTQFNPVSSFKRARHVLKNLLDSFLDLTRPQRLFEVLGILKRFCQAFHKF